MDGRELKQYEQWRDEAHRLRAENQHLEAELNYFRPAWHRASLQISVLEKRVAELTAENDRLKQQVKELTVAAEQASAGDVEAAPFAAKPPVHQRRRKRPGRKPGHPAALRPMPDHIDVHRQVPLPRNAADKECCPTCNSCVVAVEDHERVVEDTIPAKKVVTCYHTRGGWCPVCKKYVESRAPEQPPAANIPHGQLGLNALVTAILLRIVYRLPFRQVKGVFADLHQLPVSAAAIARQVQRIADWLDGDYEQLLVGIRAADFVYGDETSWRIDGRNVVLWAVTTHDQTLYHIDKSHGAKVIRGLLGSAFGGTLISDFSSVYASMDCKKQKCLVHLLRDLRESALTCPAFASGSFCRRCKRLIKEMLLLKKQWDKLSDEQYDARARRMEARLEALANGTYYEANAKRLAKRLRKYKKELTAFLWEEHLDGTNNAAERAIRPAVIARKISGGSRSTAGAEAWATLASLLRTARQQGKNLFDTVRSLLVAAWAAAKPPTFPAGP